MSSSGEVIAVPAPSWPPQALYLHPGIAYTGSDTDIQSITFANGLTMNVTGSGANVRIDAQGLHFGDAVGPTVGKYLTYAPPSPITYDGVAIFGRLTTFADTNTGWQTPIGLLGNGENILTIYRKKKQVASDLGSGVASASALIDFESDASLTIGAYFDLLPEHQEYGASHAVWLNGRLAGGSHASEAVTPTSWSLGQNFIGTLHEGIVFARAAGVTDPLLPPGGSCQWIMENLAAA